MSQNLRLKAESQADLAVIAAALQDAIARVGDMRFDSKARSLTLRVTRFRHEAAKPARVQTGLRIDNVLGLQSRGLERSDPDAMAVLLDITFSADDDPPGGILSLTFAGGGEIRAQIEALDMILADVSESRPTRKVPLHPDV